MTMTLRCLLSDEAAALYMTSDDESLNLKRVLSMYFVVFFQGLPRSLGSRATPPREKQIYLEMVNNILF